MKDHLPAIGGRTLRQLTLPASHDAGMYEIVSNDPTGAAQTQDLSLFDQLSHGIRYFDLRPQWDKNTLSFNIYHDIFGEGDAIGPPLAEVLADVKRFIEAQREVVILKFSKYSLFDTAASNNGDPAFGESDGAVRSRKRYDRLVHRDPRGAHPLPLFQARGAAAGRHFPERPAEGPQRSRHRPGGGRRRPAADHHIPWGSTSTATTAAAAITTPGFDSQGDLRVFDKFFEGDRRPLRRPPGRPDEPSSTAIPSTGDDLFLLSWTATPLPVRGPAGESVNDVSRTTNRNLATGIAEFGRNQRQQIVNLVFVNYGEEARVTDVCLHYGGVVPHAAGDLSRTWRSLAGGGGDDRGVAAAGGRTRSMGTLRKRLARTGTSEASSPKSPPVSSSDPAKRGGEEARRGMARNRDAEQGLDRVPREVQADHEAEVAPPQEGGAEQQPGLAGDGESAPGRGVGIAEVGHSEESEVAARAIQLPPSFSIACKATPRKTSSSTIAAPRVQAQQRQTARPPRPAPRRSGSRRKGR